MIDEPTGDVSALVENLYRSDSRRVFATLIRLSGDFDPAEEAPRDGFRAWPEQWRRKGVVPDITVGREAIASSGERRLTTRDGASDHVRASCASRRQA